MKFLKDKRGDVAVTVLIKVLVFFMLIAILLSVIPIFFFSHKINVTADKMLRADELSGRAGSAQAIAILNETNKTLTYNATPNWTGTVFTSSPKVNLGDKIQLKLTGTYPWKTPFGFTINITISASAVGSSEVYYGS